MRYHRNDLHGLLLVDKPEGASSMDVVRVVRRAAGGVKTGHAGTLDPLATGLLICCLGKATRQVDQLMADTKVYEAVVDLSAFTTTDDREGEREEIACSQPPDAAAIAQACANLTGLIEQVPPAFSAVHVQGQRAYRLARKGQAVELTSRTVHIMAIEAGALHWPLLPLRVTCGKGTYIRSLARDLGCKLSTGGHLTSLRRTAIGAFDVRDAISLETIRDSYSDAMVMPADPTAPARQAPGEDAPRH